MERKSRSRYTNIWVMKSGRLQLVSCQSTKVEQAA